MMPMIKYMPIYHTLSTDLSLCSIKHDADGKVWVELVTIERILQFEPSEEDSMT